MLSVVDGLHGAPAAKRPNFLFIITDDQAAQSLKIYNPLSTLQTPVLDRLATQGMTFDGAHHMGAFISAVCTPSRHMIDTGRTLWHLPASLTSLRFRQLSRGTLSAGHRTTDDPRGVQPWRLRHDAHLQARQ